MTEQQTSSHPSVALMWNDYCAALGDGAAAVRAGGFEAWHFESSEGDLSLDYWRRVHAAFFGRQCAHLVRAFSDETPVLCEEFRVVYPTPAPA